MSTERYKKQLAYYDAIVDELPNIKRKGKANPYTSLNGHMFSFLDKEATLCIRLSKEDKLAYEHKYKTGDVIQHNCVMNGYVPIVDTVLNDKDELLGFFEKSISFIQLLKPKPTKKS